MESRKSWTLTPGLSVGNAVAVAAQALREGTCCLISTASGQRCQCMSNSAGEHDLEIHAPSKRRPLMPEDA